MAHRIGDSRCSLPTTLWVAREVMTRHPVRMTERVRRVDVPMRCTHPSAVWVIGGPSVCLP